MMVYSIETQFEFQRMSSKPEAPLAEISLPRILMDLDSSIVSSTGLYLTDAMKSAAGLVLDALVDTRLFSLYECCPSRLFSIALADRMEGM